MPFAVVGSNAVIESQGRRVRGRKYPWGIVEGRQYFIMRIECNNIFECARHCHLTAVV